MFNISLISPAPSKEEKMTNEQFKKALILALQKKYKYARFNFTLIQRSTYELEHSRQFYVSAAINFQEPVAIVVVTEFDRKEIFLVFIDKKGIGHICPEDTEKRQHKSPIANFSTQV